MTEASFRLFPALFRRPRQRPCYVRSGVQSTFVVPGDWVPDDQATELVRTYGTPMLGETSDVLENDVEFYVDGHDAYAAIADELDDILDSTAEQRAGALVIHVGWTCQLSTHLGSRGSYQDYMQALVTAGVKTRALYWAGSRFGGLRPDQEALEASFAFINGLRPAGVAQAYTDSQNLYSGAINSGSHHQKIWIILGRQYLTAYFGGVDVHPNRILTAANFKDPWHDVHARVRGPAAERFLGIVLYRLMGAISWNGQAVPAPNDPPPASAGTSHPPAVRQWDHRVSVNALYNHWTSNRSRITRRYRHNPVRLHAGSTVGNPEIEIAGFRSEIHYMVSHAIEQARRFVYVEDQYFWHHEMAQRLGRQVASGAIKILIVVTNVSADLAEHPPHTQLGLWNLARAAGSHTDRILVFERIGTTGRYVHAKMFIYDDVCAHVGSANFNNRGYFHDSESAGVWVDRVVGTTSWDSIESTLARKLRVKLWEKHLGIDAPHLYDALGASVYWQELATRTGSAGATVGPGTRSPTVQIATLEGQRWPEWASAHSSQEPPSDVPVTRHAVTEGMDWIVDPV